MFHPLIVKKLIDTAERSPHPVYRHACIIISRKGELLCAAYNDKSGHAEMLALAKFFKAHKPRGKEIGALIVVRITKSGRSFALSIPCNDCNKYLSRLQIPWYTFLGNRQQFQVITNVR